jgi:uncharacterized protein YgfB (UPF0149 family)
MPIIMSTFAEQLWNVPPGVTEASLHGTVCGLLCGAPGLSVLAYRRALIDLLERSEDMHDDEVERFVTLASEDLDAPDLSFEPLLPDHDVPLALRLTSLAEWAGGFVLGFEEVGGELDGEALEAFNDILSVSELSADEIDETDAEFDYVEVTEHLKVAVLMVHDTVNSLDEESPDEWD